MDHNVRSLDGKGTLYGMGIVLSLTGSKGSPASLLPVLISWQKLLKVVDITQSRQIDVLSYIAPQESGFSKIKFSSFENLKITTKNNCQKTVLDLLWHAAHFTQINDEQGRPGWSGYE